MRDVPLSSSPRIQKIYAFSPFFFNTLHTAGRCTDSNTENIAVSCLIDVAAILSQKLSMNFSGSRYSFPITVTSPYCTVVHTVPI
jgi:hypothetical protein